MISSRCPERESPGENAFATGSRWRLGELAPEGASCSERRLSEVNFHEAPVEKSSGNLGSAMETRASNLLYAKLVGLYFNCRDHSLHYAQRNWQIAPIGSIWLTVFGRSHGFLASAAVNSALAKPPRWPVGCTISENMQKPSRPTSPGAVRAWIIRPPARRRS
jgi:hypothetical protein